jgi:hypothetical protein
VAASNHIDISAIEKQISNLSDLIGRRDEAALLQVFYEMAPSYRCDKADSDAYRLSMDCLRMDAEQITVG